jgi:hypothetical protein
MSGKTTISIDIPIQRTIKKIAALLELSQGDVINMAIHALERFLLTKRKRITPEKTNLQDELDRDMQPYLLEAMQNNPALWRIYSLLQEKGNELDEVLLTNWTSELEE